MGWTKNFSKPEGMLGRLLLNGMNSGHTSISKWGLAHYGWEAHTAVLDIGCGGGANIARLLAACPRGWVAGIDISDESVKKSREVNRAGLGKRCEIKKGTAESIPFADGTFDAVTTFESIYFWKDVSKAFAEVRRVLRPGGTFMVVCEMSSPECIWSGRVEGMTIYTPPQLAAFFAGGGFRNIKTDIAKKTWVCVSGER